MPNTFTWAIQSRPTGDEAAHVRSAKLGDGYEQVVQVGINNLSSLWPITVAGASVDVIAARDFLRSQAGRSFLWTPPRDVQGLYRCKSWRLTPEGGDAYTLAATFEQAFAP